MCFATRGGRRRVKRRGAACVGAARGQLGRLRLRRASPARIAGVGLGTNRGALSSAATRPASLPASRAEHSQSVCRRGLLQQVPPSLLLSLLVSVSNFGLLPFAGRLFSHVVPHRYCDKSCADAGPNWRNNLSRFHPRRFAPSAADAKHATPGNRTARNVWLGDFYFIMRWTNPLQFARVNTLFFTGKKLSL